MGMLSYTKSLMWISLFGKTKNINNITVICDDYKEYRKHFFAVILIDNFSTVVVQKSDSKSD